MENHFKTGGNMLGPAVNHHGRPLHSRALQWASTSVVAADSPPVGAPDAQSSATEFRCEISYRVEALQHFVSF